MVQKQAANSIRSHGDDFADDDPLAELARIVGFDQPLKREPVVSLPQAPDLGVVEFNLEDELMREFDGYQAAPVASHFVPEPVVPRPVSLPVYEAPTRREEPSFEPARREDVDVASVYEPELPAFSAPAAPSVSPYAPASDDYVQAAPAPVVSWQEIERPAEPDMSFDLADELEFAVADADIRPEPVAPVQRPLQPEPPRLRLPLANFSAQPVRRVEPEVPVEPPRAAAAFDLSPFETATASQPAPAAPASDLGFGRVAFDWASGPVEPIPAAEPVFAAPKPAPVALDVSPAQGVSFAVEAERRTAPSASAPVETPARAGRDEPDFSFDFLDELAMEEEVAAAPKAREPVVERAAASAEEDFDPFADHEFDLQLDDIELDLSDIDVAPAKSQPAVPMAAPTAPVFAAAVSAPSPQRQAPSFAAAAPSAASFVQPTVQPLQPSGEVSRAVEGRYSSAPVVQADAAAPAYAAAAVQEHLGFDPSEISEQDDLLEALSGMDVPDVPVTETRPAQTAQPDYDIDIDAELATLFQEPVAPPQAKPIATSRVAPAPVAAAPVARAPAQPLDDFDAFEKALEEDFRSSLTSTGAFEPESRGHITIAGEGQGFRFRRIKPYLMAGTAAIVLLAGAGGLYAWLSSGAVGTLSGGEPQVIAADKSPVKIVPEDPGGKSVPNQDKAVYDRVAGNGVEDPKQQSLISSEEQPVDVVQRTLIPEALPMEGESEAMATPVGETEDPRLLPDGQPQQAAAEDPATITPRRVRTMIVRPDGTLVAQDLPAEPTPAPVQTTAAAPAQAAPETPVLAAPSVPAANTGDAVQTVDTRVVTPGGAAAASTSAAASPAAAPTTATTPAEAPAAVETPAPAATADATAPRAPIPTTRPADQPVNVVGTVTDQGNLRPTQPTASAPAQAEVAAAPPAAATPAPAAATPAGSFGIQIASLPSEADAQKSYRSLSAKFGNVLGGKPWEIRQADIPGKGTFYRVRIVAGSKDDAVALCEQYRAAGGSCLVSR